jgi:hypothetical protein
MARYFLSIRSFFVLAAALSGLLLVAGCGDDSEASGGEIVVETGSLPKAQFIKRADAICDESIEKVQLAGVAYLRDVEGSDKPYEAQQEEAPKFIETVLAPQFEGQIDQVSSLGAPKGDEEEVAAVLEAMRQTLEEAEAEPVKFLQSVNPFEKAEKVGKKYGFENCGGLGFNYN